MKARHLCIAVLACAIPIGYPPVMLAAAGSQPAEATSKPAPSITIGLIMKTLTNPFFVDMERGARRAESELGIRLVVKTGAQETSISQQIAIVEEMTAQRIDAIVIAPGSSTELVLPLKKAQDADIRIVNIDNRLDADFSKRVGLRGVPFVSVDNEKGAYLSARYIAQKARRPARAAILEGIRAADNARQRLAGALRAFKEVPSVQVVATDTANWKIDEAAAVTAKILDRHPDLRLLFCSNDMMALGAIQHLQRSGRRDVLVAGYDALAEAIKAIRNGTLQATVDQQAAQQGYLGIRYALELIRGAAPPPETIVDVKLITKETLR
jgi:ribose transport system substrate-binding protein